jgi:hypothetical protein
MRVAKIILGVAAVAFVAAGASTRSPSVKGDKLVQLQYAPAVSDELRAKGTQMLKEKFTAQSAEDPMGCSRVFARYADQKLIKPDATPEEMEEWSRNVRVKLADPEWVACMQETFFPGAVK